MKVLVTGGRHFCDVARLWRALDRIDARVRGMNGGVGIACVIEGASDDVTGPYVGADWWAHQWARAHDRETNRYHADWTVGRSAGPMRNTRMLGEKPDVVVAFPGGAGTANMVKQALAAGIKVERW